MAIFSVELVKLRMVVLVCTLTTTSTKRAGAENGSFVKGAAKEDDTLTTTTQPVQASVMVNVKWSALVSS
ncbi:unnamed protein product [Phytophthora lilii]|uniref:Unnamed protein product n=1 Tax=Phytophthora lilii TaxID=2077276 RepID=A0A9W6U2Z8_9STRA|nr:unnamed protein product [Phytophthora lilii]